jgi:hypothetical protein
MTFSRAETVTLGLLATLGATALDTGVAAKKWREFEERFAVKITEAMVVTVIDKIAHALSGSEQIIIN